MNDFLAYLTYPDIDPRMVYYGRFAIRWYGVSYLLGFILAYWLLRYFIRRKQFHITHDRLGDLITYLAVGVMVGGRTGWWLFYHVRDPDIREYWYTPLAVWQGGMSFHGGLTGVIIVLAIWAYFNKISFWHLIDATARVTPVGLFFGRIANFINKELVGRPSDLPWAVQFSPNDVPRHPSQIYEAILEGPVLLLLLWLYYRFGRPRRGQVGAMFVMVYAVIRFSVEYTRAPDPQLAHLINEGWGFSRGQQLSLVMLAIGIAMWLWRQWKGKEESAIPTAQ